MRDYEPYGEVLAQEGGDASGYGYTGEMFDTQTGLVFLRARYYSPADGRFLSKDAWQGDTAIPLSLNKWNYVSGNPINHIDPFGLWELAPGFNLHEGGIYDKGVLEMQGSPTPCSVPCIGSASIDISIFVPPIANGKLYNDQHYGRYGYTDIRRIKKLIEYDAIGRNKLAFCHLDEFVIPKDTDDWKETFQKIGDSYTFSQGALIDTTVLIGLGMGYDSGYSPIDMTLNSLAYYSNNASIANQLYIAQSQSDRERLNMIELFEQSGKAGIYEAVVGGVVFITQAAQGLQAFKHRSFTITVEENKRVPSLYRARIETSAGFQEVKSGRMILSSYFLSFENGSWREKLFNVATSASFH